MSTRFQAFGASLLGFLGALPAVHHSNELQLERSAVTSSQSACPGMAAPLRLAWKPNGTALLTTSEAEYQDAVDRYGYTDGHGIVARVSIGPGEGLAAVYRMYNPSSYNFRWVTTAERAKAEAAGFVAEKIDFYARAAETPGCTAVRSFQRGSQFRSAITSVEQWQLIKAGWSTNGTAFWSGAENVDLGLMGGKVVVDGDLVAAVEGQVVGDVDVRGSVLIRAPRTTLQDSIVRGGTNAPARRYWPLVDARSGFSGTVIKNSVIQEAVASEWNASGIGGYNFRADKIVVVGQVDSVNITGSNVVIRDSILRDNVQYQNHWQSQPFGPSHNDNVQVLRGDNILIEKNILTGSKSLGIVAAPEWGSMNNLVVRGNFVDDGECSIKVSDKGGNAYSVAVVDNVLGGHQVSWKCHVVTEGSTSARATVTGNVLGSGGVPTRTDQISQFATTTPARIVAV